MRVVVVLPSRVGNWQVSSSSSPSSSSLSSSSPSSPSPSTSSHCFLNSNFIFHSHSHFSTKAGPPTCPPISNFNPACSAHSWCSRFEYTPQLSPRTLALLHFLAFFTSSTSPSSSITSRPSSFQVLLALEQFYPHMIVLNIDSVIRTKAEWTGKM